MSAVRLPIVRASDCKDLPLPGYASDGASGIDLYAAVDAEEVLQPGERRLIRTGIHVAIPEGFEGQVRPRSGIALKRGLGFVNSPGTIDSDYRGEIQLIAINWSTEPQTIKRGERMAQLVIGPIIRVEIEEADRLDPTERGPGGFGHTGV